MAAAWSPRSPIQPRISGVFRFWIDPRETGTSSPTTCRTCARLLRDLAGLRFFSCPHGVAGTGCGVTRTGRRWKYGGAPTALAPDALRGRYLALFSLVWTIAGIASPTMVSLLLSINGVMLWVGMGAAALATAAVAFYSERVIDPDVQRMPV